MPNPAAVIVRLQIALAALLIASGVTLAGLFGVALIGYHQLAFQALWTIHVGVHCLVVGVALTLLIHLARELTPGGTTAYLSLLALACVVHVCSALMPWTSFHSVSLELPLARWWLGAGRIIDISWFPGASLPGGMVPAFTGFLDRRVFFLLSTYHSSYVLILAGLLSTFVYYKTHDEELSLWAALVLLFCPVVVYTSGQPSDILPAACFFSLAYGSAILWGEQKARWHWLIVPGLALGFGWFVSAQVAVFGIVLLVSLFGFYLSWKHSVVRAALAVLTIFVSALASASLLLFRNFVWNGNPIYPLVSGQNILVPFQHYPLEWCAGMLFLILSVVPVFRKSRNMLRVSPWARATWFTFLGGFFVSWVVYSQDLVEIGFPFLVPLLVLAAVGFEQMFERKQAQKANVLMRTTLAGHITLVTAAAVASGGLWQSGLVATRRLSAQDYLAQNLEGYPAARTITHTIPRGGAIFLVGSKAPLYYVKKEVGGVSQAGEVLNDLLTEEADARSFAERLVLGGVKYFVIGDGAKSGMTGLTPESLAKWRSFLQNHCEIVGDANGESMLRIRVAGS